MTAGVCSRCRANWSGHARGGEANQVIAPGSAFWFCRSWTGRTLTSNRSALCTGRPHRLYGSLLLGQERLGRVRRWEAAAAMAVLGVADHRWLDYSDGALAGLDPTGPVARVADLIVAEQPDTVLTFGPDGVTFHPDHVTVSAWVGAACEKVGFRGRLLQAAVSQERWRVWAERYEQWGVFMTDDRPDPVPLAEVDLRLALHGATMDRKVAALLAMHTQTAPALALLGETDFRALNNEECFVLA